MTTAELIADKVQGILGEKYVLFVNHAYQMTFTTPTTNPFGIPYDMNYQAFDKYAEKIPATVSTQNNSLVSTAYRVEDSSYTINFWVPVDFYKGETVAKFDFYADIGKLSTALKGKKISFTDGNTTLKAYFTISEPLMVGTLDKSGSYTRIQMQITGRISLCDTKLATGDDYSIGIMISGTERKFENITDFSITTSSQANEILNSNTVVPKQDVATTGWACSFSVDDYDSANKPAVKLLQDMCFRLTTELSPTETTKRKKLKIKTKLYVGTSTTPTADFWGVLSCTYSVSGMAGFGSYTVTISYSGE